MAFPQGCSFRASLAYVSDGANDNLFQGSTGSPYPQTTTQGNTAGWEATTGSGISSANRSTTIDHRLAGIVFSPNDGTSGATFRIDLPAAGTYNIRMALGDATSEQKCSLELFDNTTSLGVVVSAGDTVAAGRFWDATGVLRTSAADWVTNNASISKTFASTICRFKLTPTNTSLSNPIAYFYIESAVTTTTVALTGQAASAAGGTLAAGQGAAYFPGIDITQSGWTTSTGSGTLSSMVDETSPSDTDYDQSAVNPSGDVLELKFLNVQPPSSNTGVTVSYRIKGDASTPVVVNFVCGTTIIKTWTHSPAPSTFTTYNQSLTSTEAGNVTNWPDVRLRLTAG